MDARTTRHAGYAASRRIKKRIEEGFGRIETIGGRARTRLGGAARAGWSFSLAASAYDLIRLPKLLGGSA